MHGNHGYGTEPRLKFPSDDNLDTLHEDNGKMSSRTYKLVVSAIRLLTARPEGTRGAFILQLCNLKAWHLLIIVESKSTILGHSNAHRGSAVGEAPPLLGCRG